MLTVDEYQDLLIKRKELKSYFNEEYENTAKNSVYRRNKKSIKKSQKDTEKEESFALNVWRSEVKAYIKGENLDMDMEVVKTKKENKLITLFKKLFRIKPKETQQIGIEKQEELPESEEQAQPEAKEEIVTTPISTETIDGQMDIEELNDGEIYEEE